ncbi:MAG: 4Fe-4S binding protein [Anaerolineae bacterium]
MYGTGIIKGLGVTIKHFITTYVEDIKYLGRRVIKTGEGFDDRQGVNSRGIYTVQYPEEKIAVPERFRFVPFLVTEDPDHPERPNEDWCTSCGICSKVCPPQCIWIVRGEDPVTKRPIPQPEAFFIDIDICMNCGFCAEFCPFDAIKMDHDYELASYDRTGNHIYDKKKLSKPFSYWYNIAPTTATEEATDRGGWEHSDNIKEMKKQGKQPTPVSTPYTEVRAEWAASAGTSDGAVAAAVVAAPAEDETEKAARLARRQEALARKRARDARLGIQ